MRPLIGIPCHSNRRRPKYLSRFCVRQTYCRVLRAVGGAPILIPLLEDDETLLDVCERLDGLLLAGGGDIKPQRFGQTRLAKLKSVDPPRDRVELLLVRRAVDDGLPVLAICRGLQVLNVALGGTLYQDISMQVPNALRHDFHPDHPRNYLGHDVLVRPGTRLADVVGVGRLAVNSFHHQSAKDVAPALAVAASAPDGVIEAVECQDRRFIVGVQWHPEDLVEDDPRMKRLFGAFVEEARTCHRPR